MQHRDLGDLLPPPPPGGGGGGGGDRERTGLSDVIGSWKIIEIALPRTRRISGSLSARRSRSSSSRTRPPTICPGRVRDQAA